MYFIFKSGVVAQGVVYTKERKNLVRYKDVEAEESKAIGTIFMETKIY